MNTLRKRQVVPINWAPVLPQWAAVVAERLDFGHDEPLAFGRAVAELNASSKGFRLGRTEPNPAEVRQ